MEENLTSDLIGLSMPLWFEISTKVRKKGTSFIIMQYLPSLVKDRR
jgi:hypothetical protein